MQTSWLHNSQQSRSFTQPLLSGVRTDKNLCRCFGAPVCRVFPYEPYASPPLLMKYSLPVLPPARFQTHARAAAPLAAALWRPTLRATHATLGCRSGLA